MGTATIEAHRDLVEKLKLPQFSDIVRIVKQGAYDERDICLLLVSSPLLPAGYQFQQDLILEGDKVRFKTSQDT